MPYSGLFRRAVRLRLLNGSVKLKAFVIWTPALRFIASPLNPQRSRHESDAQFFVVKVEKRAYISSVPVEGDFSRRVAGLKRRSVK